MDEQAFREQLIELGIVSYSKQETLLGVAKRCVKTIGVPMAGAGAVGMAGAGSVILPGVGAVPGYLAGALAGMLAGTVTCTMLNTTFREDLKRLAEGLP